MVAIAIRGHCRARRSFVGMDILRREATALIEKSDAETKHVQQQLIHEVSNDYTGAIREQFIVAINKMTDAASLAALQAAIESGDWQAIQQEVGISAYQLALSSMNNALMDAFVSSGVKMAELITSGKADAGPVALQTAFDRTNPDAVQAMRQLTSNLTSVLQNDTAQAVQSILQDQVANGTNPKVAAAQLKKIVGLNQQQATALQNYEAALQKGAIGTAKNYSLSQTDQQFLTGAAKNGTPLPQAKIDQLVENYRKRLIAQRANTIAQTESMGAVSSGADHAWQQAVASSGLPAQNFKRFWISTNDNRTRPDHVAIPHLNADGVGMNEPFRYPGGTIMRPHDPNAPAKEVVNCRCCQAIRYVPPTMVAPLPVFAGTSILPGSN
jgi:hypothetical protein